MATAFLQVIDEATGEIQTRVDLAISVVEDFRPVWQRYKTPWYRTRQRMFATQGRSTGATWPGYEQTAEREQYRWIKARITGNVGRIHRLKPLRWENGKERLAPSLMNPRHPDAIYTPRERSLTIGTRVPYASNHDKGQGYSPPWRNLRRYRIPKRPLLRFGTAALVSLNEVVSEHAAACAAEMGRVEVGFSTDAVARRLRVSR